MHDNLPAYAKGVLGEAAVCDRLTDGGMELLERRFRSPFGEIDLIMLDGDVLAFVEVKLLGFAGDGRWAQAFAAAGGHDQQVCGGDGGLGDFAHAMGVHAQVCHALADALQAQENTPDPIKVNLFRAQNGLNQRLSLAIVNAGERGRW